MPRGNQDEGVKENLPFKNTSSKVGSYNLKIMNDKHLPLNQEMLGQLRESSIYVITN